jgi:hypothetical protein
MHRIFSVFGFNKEPPSESGKGEKVARGRWQEKGQLGAMNDSVKWWFWSSGILKVLNDTAPVTSPFRKGQFFLSSCSIAFFFRHQTTFLQTIVKFAQESYVDHRIPGRSSQIPPIGQGICYAFGLLGLQIISPLGTHHFSYRAMSTGVLLRGGLITAIYARSLRLTARARSTLTNGKLVNHISTDVSRIDFCCGFFHQSWSAVIQLGICLTLLILKCSGGFRVFLAGYSCADYGYEEIFQPSNEEHAMDR